MEGLTESLGSKNPQGSPCGKSMKRDSNQCVKCYDTENLQCHHIIPVNIEPLLSADIDNCIILCYNCHKKVHKKDGCKFGQLRIEIC